MDVNSLSEILKNDPKLRLLFVTQVIDKQDTVLGFVVRWVDEFVAQGVKLTVFARYLKKYDLPPDVRAIELGQPKIRRIFKLWYSSIKYRNEYDSVLVHMTPEILVMGWPIWFVLRKKVFLWYIHPHVSWWLRVALVLCRNVFTAAERSLNSKTHKKIIVGHGIDTEQFKPLVEDKNQPVILYVGRISPVKKVEDMLEFLGKFHQRFPNDPWIFSMVGSKQGHEAYFDEIKLKAEKFHIADRLIHHPPIEHGRLPEVYSSACVSMNATSTGSMDKVVLESLACGTPVVAAGKDYLELKGVMDISRPDTDDKLHAILLDPKVDIEARGDVIKKHDLKRLVDVLIGHIKARSKA